MREKRYLNLKFKLRLSVSPAILSVLLTVTATTRIKKERLARKIVSGKANA
jgi:hypothetical protein